MKSRRKYSKSKYLWNFEVSERDKRYRLQVRSPDDLLYTFFILTNIHDQQYISNRSSQHLNLFERSQILSSQQDNEWWLVVVFCFGCSCWWLSYLVIIRYWRCPQTDLMVHDWIGIFSRFLFCTLHAIR